VPANPPAVRAPVVVPAPAAAAPMPGVPRTPAVTKVSYVSGASAYVDAGRNDGVRIGDTLGVVRAGRQVAALLVTYSASHRAACDTLWTRTLLALGDEVRYMAAPVAAPDVVVPALTAAAEPRARVSRPHRLRGRVGARWLSVETAGGRFQQPALDMRLDGNGSGGGHVDISLDMRSRRTTRDFVGSSRRTDEFARVYRATLTVRSLDSHHGFVVGRQTSPTLASINLFDGALLRSGTDRYTFGLFSGTQPDPLRYEFSSDIIQSGAFVEWRQAPRAERRYTVAAGGVTSQQRGQPNRDFLFAQGNWFSTGLSTSLTQEVDINRGWKRALGEPAIAPTSTFGMARVMVTRWAGVSAGYDNRRNVRLYRDRLTPETDFDDIYRQGAWLGSDAQFVKHLRVAAEVRTTAGGDRSHAWNWSTEVFRLGPVNGAVRARMSRYDASSVTSELASGSVGLDPWPLSHVEAAGGVRRTRSGPAGLDDVEHWQSVDVDVTLGRRWYASGGWEHDRGGASGQSRQLQGGLSWRF
jgi:hypothetical protein